MRTYYAAALLAVVGTPAFACDPRCSSKAEHKASSVVPADAINRLNKNGDGFTNDVFNLNLQGNRSATIELGFRANIGGTFFSSVRISENGILSFQNNASSLQTFATGGGDIPFRPVESLKEFDAPVIAPFYADLQEGQRRSKFGPEVGQIFYQYGVADPTPDANGNYSFDKAVRATRITWYGLPVGQTTDGTSAAMATASDDGLAWAQILFTDMGNGNFNFEFRTGNPSQVGPVSQAGLGSLAGFNLNGQLQEFRGPYDDSTPSYFAFRDGAFVTGGVPEPESWTLMILGFGAIGWGARQRVRKTTLSFA